MELGQIEAFVNVVDLGSFVQAAAVLHLSQPAVSRRISLLEKELGVALFDRQPTGVALTEAGRAYLPFARQVLAAVADGFEAMSEYQEGFQGVVKVALVGTLAGTALTEKLRIFREAHPGVQLLLRTVRSNEVSLMVQSGEVHIGLRYFHDSSPQLHSLAVAEEEMVVAGASDSSDVLAEISIEDLRDRQWISFPLDGRSSGGPFARVLRKQLLIAGIEDAQIITIDSLTAQKRLIESGFGIGLLPISSIREELSMGALRVLPVPALQAAVPIVLLYRKQGHMSQAMQNLVELIARAP